MAWNEPGSNGDEKEKKDPWTGGGQKPKGPPDLDEALRQLRKKFLAALGEIKKRSGRESTPPESFHVLSVMVIAAIAFVIWVFAGIFIVDPAEQAVILTFGQYSETVGPGPHWIPRFIQSAYIVNGQKISNYSYDAQMLTQDKNIVSVALAVQYRISNAKDFLFNVVNPTETLQQATASALRQVIGRTSLDAVLTSGRELVRQQVQVILEQTLQRYNTGLLITDVVMQPAKAPDEVKEAFDDAIKAQEDEQRFQNQAQAYAMQVEPIAKGQVLRLLADAQAYKQQIVLHAQGDVSEFLALLPEYQKATVVTRERLYLDALESVFSKSTKILLDASGNNNMMYLPLDKLLHESKPKPSNTISEIASSSTTLPTTIQNPSPAPASADTSSTADASSYPSKGGYQ